MYHDQFQGRWRWWWWWGWGWGWGWFDDDDDDDVVMMMMMMMMLMIVLIAMTIIAMTMAIEKLVWACEPVKIRNADLRIQNCTLLHIYIYIHIYTPLLDRYHVSLLPTDHPSGNAQVVWILAKLHWFGTDAWGWIWNEITRWLKFKHSHQFKCLPSQWYWPHFSTISKILLLYIP